MFSATASCFIALCLLLIGTLPNDEPTPAEESTLDNLPVNGAQWVDLFVREMMSATSVNDVRARAARLLEILEKSISSKAAERAVQSFQKVSISL